MEKKETYTSEDSKELANIIRYIKAEIEKEDNSPFKSPLYDEILKFERKVKIAKQKGIQDLQKILEFINVTEACEFFAKCITEGTLSEPMDSVKNKTIFNNLEKIKSEKPEIYKECDEIIRKNEMLCQKYREMQDPNCKSHQWETMNNLISYKSDIRKREQYTECLKYISEIQKLIEKNDTFYKQPLYNKETSSFRLIEDFLIEKKLLQQDEKYKDSFTKTDSLLRQYDKETEELINNKKRIMELLHDAFEPSTQIRRRNKSDPIEMTEYNYSYGYTADFICYCKTNLKKITKEYDNVFTKISNILRNRSQLKEEMKSLSDVQPVAKKLP